MTVGNVNPGCRPVDPCCFPMTGCGFGTNRYAFVLVLFILLVIVGAAFWY